MCLTGEQAVRPQHDQGLSGGSGQVVLRHRLQARIKGNSSLDISWSGCQSSGC